MAAHRDRQGATGPERVTEEKDGERDNLQKLELSHKRVQPTAHMGPRTALNAAPHTPIKFLKTRGKCRTDLSLSRPLSAVGVPGTILLPAWPGEATRVGTLVYRD